MIRSRLHHDLSDTARFRTGISLHGHTLHSHETLAFVYRLARSVARLRAALDAGERKHWRRHQRRMDLGRAYWTPPVAALDALRIEAAQIETLGLVPLVSLTDHDGIDAALSLHVLEQYRDIPVSVEWTIPHCNTFFHVGVHNIDPERARVTMALLAGYTSAPDPARLGEILQCLTSDPATLVVFNHPLWDENGIGENRHRALATQFTRTFWRYLHALELNGMRPWNENRDVVRMAEEARKPVISGDRHALEPATILNVTVAATLAEFVSEIRDGQSHVLLMPHYREAHSLRMLQNIQDILGFHENHGRGRKAWDDRVFYIGEDGEHRPLSRMWGERHPFAVRVFVGAVEALRHPHLKGAFRLAFARGQEALP